MLDLGIVIVNWNTRDYLRRCLQTVFASEGEFSYRVVVVDNGSVDGSDEMVARTFPDVTVIGGHGNVGYPAGNNLGLRTLGYADRAETISPAAPRYALLLNPDTELPPYALAQMITFMDTNPDVGVAGPKLVLPDGSLDLACRRSFPSPDVALWRMLGFSKLFPGSKTFARYNLTFLDEDEVAEVDSVVGAFMMVRKHAITAVGLLDERFFLYGEDLDWAKRIKEAGWSVMYYPRVRVRHVKRAASRQSDRAQYEFVRAMLLFYLKHYRAETPWPVHLAVMGALALRGGRRLWPEILTANRGGEG